MSDLKIDLKELKLVTEKAKEPVTYKHPYLPYINHIVALKLLGVRHRYIAEWLNSKFKSDKTDRDKLANLIGYWAKKKLINEEKARAIAREIQAVELEKEVIASPLKEVAKAHDINVFSGYSLGNFLTAYSKKLGSSVPPEETQALKNFYNEFSSKYEIEELVNQFVAQKDRQWD